MSTEHRRISINGLRVEIVRKDIKNLHLGVYPPNGRVRVATPLRVNDNAVRLAVIGKLGWINRQRTRFDAQSRQSEREMISGESHYFLGRRYRLNVIEYNGPSKVVLRKKPRSTCTCVQRLALCNARWCCNDGIANNWQLWFHP
jgi:predicted metal-dependent hydrolase